MSDNKMSGAAVSVYLFKIKPKRPDACLDVEAVFFYAGNRFCVTGKVGVALAPVENGFILERRGKVYDQHTIFIGKIQTAARETDPLDRKARVKPGERNSWQKLQLAGPHRLVGKHPRSHNGSCQQ